jgi:hypothetical protein
VTPKQPPPLGLSAIDRTIGDVTFDHAYSVAKWRMIVTLLSLPYVIITSIANIVVTVGNSLSRIAVTFSELANTAFAIEIEHARRYEALSGVNLGPAVGQANRYTDLHGDDPERLRTITTLEAPDPD